MLKAHPQLKEFLQVYSKDVQAIFNHFRGFILSHDKKANELIWDNYNALAIAFSKSQKLKDAYCHLSLYNHHVNFGFNRGAELSQKIIKLEGKGKLIRHIKIQDLDDIDENKLSVMLNEAEAHSLIINPLLSKINIPAESLVMSISKKKIRPM